MEILVDMFSSLKSGALAVAALAVMSVSASAMQVMVVVSKVSQHMTVTVDGKQMYDWLVSTGGPGYDTPTGTYHPFRMEKEHFSKEWDDAPMPNSMFFTGAGHAIHGSYHIARLGTRASHGCVRLAPQNAVILYGLVEKAGYRNTTFQIKGGLFDFGNSTASNDIFGKPHKPFHFFWEAKPKAKPASILSHKKKKLKPQVASNGATG